MKAAQSNPGQWLQRACNKQNRIWLLVNTLSACQSHVFCSLQWVISSFCSIPTKVNSVCISSKCQHVFVKPTSCSDNLNFPYELLLDECDIPPRLAGIAENRWPLISLVPSRCALKVLMIIGYRCLPQQDGCYEWLRMELPHHYMMELQAWPDAESRPQWCGPIWSKLIQFSQKKLLLKGYFYQMKWNNLILLGLSWPWNKANLAYTGPW